MEKKYQRGQTLVGIEARRVVQKAESEDDHPSALLHLREGKLWTTIFNIELKFLLRIPFSCFLYPSMSHCLWVIGNKWDHYLDLLQADYSEGQVSATRHFIYILISVLVSYNIQKHTCFTLPFRRDPNAFTFPVLGMHLMHWVWSQYWRLLKEKIQCMTRVELCLGVPLCLIADFIKGLLACRNYISELCTIIMLKDG
ncbi:hypothetical protein Csa_018608 [Cucumis sativus]|nr:hypothetical protein Csa_018608 [Cucumis sativus]